jgi:imidazolonepropionase-like amidohydrolase
MLAGDLRKGKAMADTAIVAKGLLVIRGGKILYAGKALKAPKFKAYETVDAGGKAVVPGFVDAHTHLVFAGSRRQGGCSRTERPPSRRRAATAWRPREN